MFSFERGSKNNYNQWMFGECIRKFIKWVGVPFTLFFIAVLLFILFFFNSDTNLFILSTNYPSSNIQESQDGISGTFMAQENYLALIKVRFNNNVVYSGNSVFRIKNVLEKDWYYEATVSALGYFTTPQYPLTIPTIEKSKNQNYQFEIRLVKKTQDMSNLVLNNEFPVLVSQYYFPNDLLLKDKRLLVKFILKKLFYDTNKDTFWKVLIVYSIPLILYLLYLVFERKIQSSESFIKIKGKLLYILRPFVIFIFLYITIDIFVIRKYSSETITLLTLLWLINLGVYKFESYYSFCLALIFLAFCPFLLSANMIWVAEKCAAWTYIFLVVGTIHTLIELKASKFPRKNDSYNRLHFISNFVEHIIFFISVTIKIVRDILSTLVIYLDSFFINYVKKLKSFALFSVNNFVEILIKFTIITTLLLTLLNIYMKVMNYRDRQLKNPGTPVVEPSLVYPGTKIILYGERFGDGLNSMYALMKDGERIRPDYWEDHKIIFTVPLSWKQPKMMNFWIEKPVEWEGKTVIERTKPIPIRLLKVTDHFTPDDDLYFEQMKTWRKETKEINGYE